MPKPAARGSGEPLETSHYCAEETLPRSGLLELLHAADWSTASLRASWPAADVVRFGPWWQQVLSGPRKVKRGGRDTEIRGAHSETSDGTQSETAVVCAERGVGMMSTCLPSFAAVFLHA